MKVMTFNIQHGLNYVEKRIDFDIMARAIMDCGADIVGLNEVRDLGTDEGYQAQTRILAELCGMEHYYFAKAYEFPGGPYGNAILSRIPILKVETIAIPDPEPRGYDGYYEPRCILKAELADGITVMVLHVGLNPDEKESAVATALSELTDEKCVLMGDFNMTPDDKTLFPIYEKMKDAARGFCDKKLSFPSVDPYCKIDYVFVSKDVKVTGADIPDLVASDHRPHTADLSF
jgi:endonuclease/exonuclease/phosphatase family metal-dependent hydrolase